MIKRVDSYIYINTDFPVFGPRKLISVRSLLGICPFEWICNREINESRKIGKEVQRDKKKNEVFLCTSRVFL